MIIETSTEIDLRIGARMKIVHGATMTDYVSESQSVAEEVFNDDGG